MHMMPLDTPTGGLKARKGRECQGSHGLGAPLSLGSHCQCVVIYAGAGMHVVSGALLGLDGKP